MYILTSDVFGSYLRVIEPKEKIHDLPKLLKGYGVSYMTTERGKWLIVKAEWETPEAEEFIAGLIHAYGLRASTWSDYIGKTAEVCQAANEDSK